MFWVVGHRIEKSRYMNGTDPHSASVNVLNTATAKCYWCCCSISMQIHCVDKVHNRSYAAELMLAASSKQLWLFRHCIVTLHTVIKCACCCSWAPSEPTVQLHCHPIINVCAYCSFWAAPGLGISPVGHQLVTKSAWLPSRRICITIHTQLVHFCKQTPASTLHSQSQTTVLVGTSTTAVFSSIVALRQWLRYSICLSHAPCCIVWLSLHGTLLQHFDSFWSGMYNSCWVLHAKQWALQTAFMLAGHAERQQSGEIFRQKQLCVTSVSWDRLCFHHCFLHRYWRAVQWLNTWKRRSFGTKSWSLYAPLVYCTACRTSIAQCVKCGMTVAHPADFAAASLLFWATSSEQLNSGARGELVEQIQDRQPKLRSIGVCDTVHIIDIVL